MMMPTRSRLLAATVAAVLVSGAATACSSSSATGAAGSSTSGAPATQGKTITLGILTPLTGPVASSFGQATIAGAQARIALANANHELPNGETIKLVSVDEGSSPQTSLPGTQQLLDHHHPFPALPPPPLPPRHHPS